MCSAPQFRSCRHRHLPGLCIRAALSLTFLLPGTPVVWAGQALLDEIPAVQQEGRLAFTEGPAWDPMSRTLFFTDIENNRILRRGGDGVLRTWRIPSGRANGLAFDARGRLYACEGHREGGNRRVTVTEIDGSVQVLTDRFEGARYNSPNDLAVAQDGAVYFTDPCYGDRSSMEITDEKGRQVEGVYRISADRSEVLRILTHEVDRPNGIALSANQRYLYVADNNNSHSAAPRRLYRFQLDAEGIPDVQSRVLLFDWSGGRGPDGLCVGPEGRLYVTAGRNAAAGAETSDYPAGVYVLDPESGSLLQTIRVPADMITNCTFGGRDGRTLFITAGGKLWSTVIPAQ